VSEDSDFTQFVKEVLCDMQDDSDLILEREQSLESEHSASHSENDLELTAGGND
jgi:hypothetical protein